MDELAKSDRGQEGLPLARFMRTVMSSPTALAVIGDERQLTYAELDAQSGRLAARLRDVGVERGDKVAIAVEDGVDFVVAVLAVQRSGGAYVPLDVSDMSSRQSDFLSRLRIRHAIGAQRVVTQFGALPHRIDIREEMPAPGGGDAQRSAADLMYVMATSGSTGRPKLIGTPDGAVGNLLRLDGPGLTAPRVLFHSARTFDASTFELWMPLATGGSVLVPPGDQRDIESQLRWGHEQGTSLMWITSSVLTEISAHKHWIHLLPPTVWAGGEQLNPRAVNRIRSERPELDVVNGYGPTETTVFAAYSQLNLRDRPGRMVPVGRPTPGTAIYVLSLDLTPVAAGEVGEIYIAGSGLAHGYLGQPDLTAERFVACPFAGPGERMFRTGDLGRWNADGDLEVLGRSDRQIKLRGYRIEPDEIEVVLQELPDVRQAVVSLGTDHNGLEHLTAYFEPSDLGATDAGAREVLDSWRTVFDNLYREPGHPLTSDYRGWDSSITGLPYSAAEMSEWVDETVQRLESYAIRRVLEIGVGTGLIMDRLADRAERYVATDISAGAIRELAGRDQYKENPSVEFLVGDAMSSLAGAGIGFDLIILNSVVQYLPSEAYFRDLLAELAKRLGPDGVIFVGDVRDASVNDMLLREIATEKLGPGAGESSIETRVGQLERSERELCLAPSYFLRFLPENGHDLSCQVLPKLGRSRTEMNRFRYDAAIRVSGPRIAAPDVPELVRRGRCLLVDRPQDELRGADRQQAVAEALSQARRAGHDAFPLIVGDGIWDQLVVVDPALRSATVEYLGSQRSVVSWTEPAKAVTASRLARRVRAELRQKLPAHLVPLHFVPVDQLPRLPSGKVDRSRLASNGFRHSEDAGGSEIERLCAGIYADILGLAWVDRRTDFFDVGGHSLHVIQLVTQLDSDLGVEVTPAEVFESPVLADLASIVADRIAGAGPKI